MTFAFARIGAVVAMRFEDYYPKGKRWKFSACSPPGAAAPMSPVSFASTALSSGASLLRREPYWPLHLSPSHNRTRYLSIHLPKTASPDEKS
jgi:hypothetical protein